MQLITLVNKIKAFFTKKKIIWGLIILFVLFLGWKIFGPKGPNPNIQTDFVKQENIEKTVLTTGQVVSATDLNLSFQSSGVVKKISVKEGDTVNAGQILAVLDQGTALANLQSAQGSLAQAQANYEKVLNGATSSAVDVAKAAVNTAQVNLDGTTTQQNLLVDNAYRNLLNSTISASISGSDNNSITPPSISGTYLKNTEGSLTFTVNGGGSTAYVTFSGIWNGTVAASTSNPQSIGDTGLFIIFNSISPYVGTTWVINIPNKNGANYLANYNAYQSALQTKIQATGNAQAALDQAKANLASTMTPPRSEDVDIAKAQILSMQGSVLSAEAVLNNTVLRAPAKGTITQVDIKIGELAQATKEVMKLLDVGELHTEALVSEADIASVAIGQSIDNTFDALGPDRHFTTTVLTVNPASTVISGVVNYKVTGSLEKITDVKPGMTDNMTIQVAQKSNVLAVKSSAIINKNNKHIVRVITDPKNKTYHEVEVQTGLEADGGLTEVISGLHNGQEVVTYIK